MLKSPVGTWLKRAVDSNDLEWIFPLPPWADERDRLVRRLRRAARAVIRRRTIAERGWLYLVVSSLAWPAMAWVKALLAPRAAANPRHRGFPCSADTAWNMGRSRRPWTVLASRARSGRLATLLRWSLGLDGLRLVLGQ